MAKKADKRANERVYLQNSIKTLVANIRFASVDDPIRSIVVTSSVPSEGKTTISIELARALAAGGKDVLLVECDLRHPSLAGALGVHPRNGIYAVLSGQAGLDEAEANLSQRGLSFLGCEPHIPSPVDILSSRRFQRLMQELLARHDYVVLDTPPVSTFVDAAVLGAEADATLLVIRENFVKRDELLAAYDQLQKAGANVIGSVLNFCKSDQNEYYYSYYAKGSKAQGNGGVSAQLDDDSAAQALAPQPKAPAQSQPQPKAPAQPQSIPGLRPIPQSSASPDSTAQFLAGTHYVARRYDEE